jgi:hypothetical protein
MRVYELQGLFCTKSGTARAHGPDRVSEDDHRTQPKQVAPTRMDPRRMLTDRHKPFRFQRAWRQRGMGGFGVSGSAARVL